MAKNDNDNDIKNNYDTHDCNNNNYDKNITCVYTVVFTLKDRTTENRKKEVVALEIVCQILRPRKERKKITKKGLQIFYLFELYFLHDATKLRTPSFS